MNAQALQIYLFILSVLNAIGSGAQSVISAFNALTTAIASGDAGQIADATAALLKALAAIVDAFKTKASGHFSAHASLAHAELQTRATDAEKQFHGLFGGGGAGGGSGSGLNLGGILQTIKNNLPLILSVLKLFGVNIPISLPTA